MRNDYHIASAVCDSCGKVEVVARVSDQFGRVEPIYFETWISGVKWDACSVSCAEKLKSG